MADQKLKIAFLSVFYPFRGGIAQFGTELLKALEDEAEVKAFNFTTQYPGLLFPGKTQFVDESDEDPGFESPRLLSSVNPMSFGKTAKAIKKYNPDVLITSYWMPFFGPSLGTVCKKLKKSTLNISLVHNAIPHETRFGDHALANYYFKQQHGFVSLSDTVTGDLKTFVPSAKVMQRPHPLYAQFGEPQNKEQLKKKYGLKETDKVLLFFGFIRKYKGLDLLLEALKDCDDNAKVLISGEVYGDFEEYQKIIDDNKLSDRIINRVGYVPDNVVGEVFSLADVCVLPYRSATQSGIASIAKYYQLPMVVTPVGELPNELVDGETGIVCESSKPIHIAQGVNRCIDSLNEFSDNLKAEKDEHTWKNFAQELVAFARSIQ